MTSTLGLPVLAGSAASSVARGASDNTERVRSNDFIAPIRGGWVAGNRLILPGWKVGGQTSVRFSGAQPECFKQADRKAMFCSAVRSNVRSTALAGTGVLPPATSAGTDLRLGKRKLQSAVEVSPILYCP